MGLCRDVFGTLSYTAKTPHGEFSIRCGDNRILREYPYLTTDAVLNIGLPMGEEIKRFPSFLLAVKFFKENINNIR